MYQQPTVQAYQESGMPIQPSGYPAHPHHGHDQVPVHVGVPVVMPQPVPVPVYMHSAGRPVPQVSEERLAQMAKDKRFRLSNGLWKLTPPPNYAMYCLIGFILVFVILAVVFLITAKSPMALIVLIVPTILMIFLLYTWGTAKLTFDDSQQVVYHRSKGAFCIARETTIRYSDCISFNAVFKMRRHNNRNAHGHMTFSTTSYYMYALSTLGGSYEIYTSGNNIEEASLNAFLRERLAYIHEDELVC